MRRCSGQLVYQVKEDFTSIGARIRKKLPLFAKLATAAISFY